MIFSIYKRRLVIIVAAGLLALGGFVLVTPAATPAHGRPARDARSRKVTHKRRTPRLLHVHVRVSPARPRRHSTIRVSFRARQRIRYTVALAAKRIPTSGTCTLDGQREAKGRPGRRITLHFRPNDFSPPGSKSRWCRGRWSAVVQYVTFGRDPCAAPGAGDFCREGSPEYDHHLGRTRYRIR